VIVGKEEALTHGAQGECRQTRLCLRRARIGR
jgi:hypothetical protein